MLYACNFHKQHLIILPRRVQLPEGGSPLQARVFVLPDSNLHPLLHVGHRIVGQLLVGPGRRSRQGITWRHNSSHHGDADLRYQRLPPTRLIH
jgi:hypothetical protein